MNYKYCNIAALSVRCHSVQCNCTILSLFSFHSHKTCSSLAQSTIPSLVSSLASTRAGQTHNYHTEFQSLNHILKLQVITFQISYQTCLIWLWISSNLFSCENSLIFLLKNRPLSSSKLSNMLAQQVQVLSCYNSGHIIFKCIFILNLCIIYFSLYFLPLPLFLRLY